MLSWDFFPAALHYGIQQLYCSIGFFFHSCVHCCIAAFRNSINVRCNKSPSATIYFVLCYSFVHYDWHWAQFESVRWFVFDWDSAIFFCSLNWSKIKNDAEKCHRTWEIVRFEKSKQIALSFIAKWMPFLPFFMTISLLVLFGEYAVFDPSFFLHVKIALHKSTIIWLLWWRIQSSVAYVYTKAPIHSEYYFFRNLSLKTFRLFKETPNS